MAMSKEERRKRALEQRGGLPERDATKPRTPIRDRGDRAEIEFELASGKSIRQIAKNTACMRARFMPIAKGFRLNSRPRTGKLPQTRRRCRATKKPGERSPFDESGIAARAAVDDARQRA